MTRSSLRRWALGQPSISCEPTSPRWLAGAALVAALVACLGLVDANDRATNQAIRAAAAERAALHARAALHEADSVPQVRLVGHEMRCRTLRVREEWIAAVASECARFATLLRNARATE